MITVEEYLAYCDKALDGYAAIARQLGDDLVNERPADLPGSNTASGLIAHAAGVIARWGSTVNLGVVVPRDRDAEFLATGTVADALAVLASARARLHADARAASPRHPPVNQPSPQDHPDFDATQGDVLLHIYEELAQHLGQLEVTRDLLLARRG